MADDDETAKKGKRGRPSQGGPGEQVRIPPATLDIIDAYAKANGISRQEAIRRLIARGEISGDG